MKKLVIFGNGLFSELVFSYFKYASDYEVEAFTAHSNFIEEPSFFDLPICPFESIEKIYPPKNCSMFIAMGYRGLNKIRASIYLEAKEKGYELVSYVHPNVQVWPNNIIGENTFIFEDNTIQPYVKIGNNTILWSGNHIGHHSTIGNHCFISSHVVVSGNCKVGDYSFLGVNSTLRDSISIGKSCIIGAGCLIMKSTNENELFIRKGSMPDSRKTYEIKF
ncbi:acetyltransferase [Thermodesulfobacteriota bacterium]